MQEQASLVHWWSTIKNASICCWIDNKNLLNTNNSWCLNTNFFDRCVNGVAVKSISSVHVNRYEDRAWTLHCRDEVNYGSKQQYETNFNQFDARYVYDRMDNEQDLCVHNLSSFCLGIRVGTLVWNSPVNQSWFPNKSCSVIELSVIVIRYLSIYQAPKSWLQYTTLFVCRATKSWSKYTTIWWK